MNNQNRTNVAERRARSATTRTLIIWAANGKGAIDQMPHGHREAEQQGGTSYRSYCVPETGGEFRVEPPSPLHGLGSTRFVTEMNEPTEIFTMAGKSIPKNI